VGNNFFVVTSSDDGGQRDVLDLTRLAVLECKARASIVPLTVGVACEVRGYCFATPGIALSETCIRLKRHQCLVLGAAANLTFRLSNGPTFHLAGTVSVHSGDASVLQLHDLSNVDRFRIRAFIRQQLEAV
jgi:hypothetical protein